MRTGGKGISTDLIDRFHLQLDHAASFASDHCVNGRKGFIANAHVINFEYLHADLCARCKREVVCIHLLSGSACADRRGGGGAKHSNRTDSDEKQSP